MLLGLCSQGYERVTKGLREGYDGLREGYDGLREGYELCTNLFTRVMRGFWMNLLLFILLDTCTAYLEMCVRQLLGYI